MKASEEDKLWLVQERVPLWQRNWERCSTYIQQQIQQQQQLLLLLL